MSAPSLQLHLVSWNVHGPPPAPRIVPRMGAVGRELARRAPDLALLQEVWTPVQADLIAARLPGYARVDTPGGGGVVGRRAGLLSLVSRRSGWRVAGHHFEEFERSAPWWRVWEGDGLAGKGLLRVDLERGGERLAVLNTHLQASYESGWSEVRRAQLAQLRASLAAVPAGVPLLVAGDLNTRPDEKIWSELEGALVDLSAPLRERCGCGTSVDAGHWIDYVLARRDPAWAASARVERIVSTRVDWPWSDHQGLDARVTLARGSAARPAAREGSALARKILRGPATRRAWLGAAVELCARGLTRFGALALLMLAGAGGARADALDALPGEPDAELRASRSERRLLETPLSLSVTGREETLRARPALGIEDALVGVPGVFTQTAPNFAQDTRVSIRGFGARAPFGIRGIRVYVDGIPTTLADGQSEVDSIDLAFVERTEVVRGPVSSLFGGGGGGVISFTTIAPTETPVVQVRGMAGSHHLSRYEALATGRVGPLGYAGGVTYTRLTGYREHARARHRTQFLKLVHDRPGGTRAALNLSAVSAPEADDPGGLNSAEVARDRSDARAAALRFDTGESLDQQRVALDLERPLGDGNALRLRAWWLERDFDNRLPFSDGGRVDLDRDAGGASLVFTRERGRLRWLGGIDVNLQDDLRRRYENLDGATGPLTLSQSETVRAVGPFAELDLRLGGGLGLVAGARYDWLEYVAGDRFTADGDQSSRFRLRELSPRIGLYLDRSPRALLYANLLSAFRPPTTTELGQDDVGGFSTDLEAERTRGVELGVKGRLGERVFYDLAGFWLRVRDAIVPFQSADGRDLARNAGKIVRLGVEAGLGVRLRRGLELRAAYTYADYRYRDFDLLDEASGAVTEYDGNREPNTPRHHLQAELRWEHPSGLFAVLGLRHFSDIEVQDSNQGESAGATLSDLRVGRDIWRGDTLVRPFVAVRNWSQVRYDGQLRPNAAFGRFFEPAPEAELMAGLELRWGVAPPRTPAAPPVPPADATFPAPPPLH